MSSNRKPPSSTVNGLVKITKETAALGFRGQNLESAKEHFHRWLEWVPDALIVINGDGKTIWANSHTEDLFGYSHEEILGKPLEILLPERVRSSHARHLTDYFANPEVRSMGAGFALCGLRKDGSEFPVDISLSPLEYEGGILASAAIRDVTQREMAEQKLRESEEKYRRLFENSRDAITLTTEEGTFLDANQAFLDMFGYSRNDLSKLRIEDLFVNIQDREKGRLEISKKGYVRDLERKFKRKDGTPIDCLITGTLHKDKETQAITYQGIIRDITQKKQREEALHLRTKKLEAQFNIAKILVQERSFKEKVTRVLEKLVQVAQGDMASLRVADEKEQGLRLVAAVGEERQEVPPRPVVPYDEGIIGPTYLTGELTVINDYPSHPMAPPHVVAAGLQSLMTIPVKVSGRMLGILTIDSIQLDHFTPDRVKQVTAVADEIGALLENARLRETEQVRTQELEAQFRIAKLLVEKGGFEEKARKVLEAMVQTAQGDMVTLR